MKQGQGSWKTQFSWVIQTLTLAGTLITPVWAIKMTADLVLFGKSSHWIQSGGREVSQSLDRRDSPHSRLVLFTASFRGVCSFRRKAWSSFNLPVRDLLQSFWKWPSFTRFHGYTKREMDISHPLQGQVLFKAELSSFFRHELRMKREVTEWGGQMHQKEQVFHSPSIIFTCVMAPYSRM